MINKSKIVMSDPILIIGAGAMACLFAARFSAAGFRVVMRDAWQEGITLLGREGVAIEENDEVKTYPVSVECPGRVKTALVLVKSWQTGWAADQLVHLLAPDGLALSLQNGLGNVDILSERLGEQRVCLGVTTYGATSVAPGRVCPGGDGKISLAEHSHLGEFPSHLEKAGFKMEMTSDATSLVWGKLVINSAINPLTALLRIKNGGLLVRPSARKLMGATAQETAVIAAAQGIALPFEDPVSEVENVAKRTDSNISSMLSDVMRNAPTEIDAINGAIAEIGEQLGISCPINRTLWLLVKALSRAG
jgi:2-dehydropantoate 2-reductase